MTGCTLAVDVGGTWMRSAIVDVTGLRLPLKKEAPGFRLNAVPLAELQDMFLGEMSALVDSYLREGFSVSRLALGFPGPVKDGYVYGAPTLWGKMSVPYPLLSGLKVRLGKKGVTELLVANDVTAAGRSYVTDENRTFCIITVSSGIGNKIFLNGRVLEGDLTIGGEIGHWYCGDAYSEFGCDCGGRGHLGAVSSGRGVERLAEKMKPDWAEISAVASLTHVTTSDIVQGLNRGDVFAHKTLNASVAPLASAINLINLATGVDNFIVVGGFALGCGEAYADALRRSMEGLQFSGHFTERSGGIRITLGNDNDFQALEGLGKMMEEDIAACAAADP